MGRWSGLSNLIDFHFDNHGHEHGSFRNGLCGVNLTTRYHKLDDSIFVLCRNCGQSMKTDELKKMAGISGPGTGPRLKANPKHFLTWSATAANNRIQRMSKNLANNITKLQWKVEKAIPFHQGVNTLSSTGDACSASCESEKISRCQIKNSTNSLENNNCVGPDVLLSTSKVQTSISSISSTSCSKNNSNASDTDNISSRSIVSSSSKGNLLSSNNTMVKQCSSSGDSGSGGSVGTTTTGGYHYQARVQNARIVQSHPSVSQTHSHGGNGNSVVNPDKIMQISIESYKYLPSSLNSCKKISEKPPMVKNFDGVNNTEEEEPNQRQKNGLENIIKASSERLGLPSSSTELCYDSGTGSANTSMSDSSLSTVATLPMSSPPWSRASSVLGSNLNSSSLMNQTRQPYTNHCDNNNGKPQPSCKTTNNNMNNSSATMVVKVNAPSHTTTIKKVGKDFEKISQDSNSTNSGVAITESTDETSLLIDNNKSNHKKGIRNGGNNRNVEICNNNNKNLVPTQDQKLGSPVASSTPLKIQTIISPAFPPSKLVVTIFEEEAELRHASWFQAGIPREIALEVLRNEPIGSFIVRESTTKSGCFALSLRVPKEFQPTGIAHYLILKTSRGYKIKGFTKEFGSLSSLITHHSVMPELLPCPLSLHRYRPKHTLRVSRANSSDFMEPEKLVIRNFTDF